MQIFKMKIQLHKIVEQNRNRIEQKHLFSHHNNNYNTNDQ